MNTILVVDDSPFIVDVFVTMLERGGYRTVAAYGGEECLEILKTVTPDLILLDIMMEPMDGWETLEKIKENSRPRRSRCSCLQPSSFRQQKHRNTEFL